MYTNVNSRCHYYETMWKICQWKKCTPFTISISACVAFDTGSSNHKCVYPFTANGIYVPGMEFARHRFRLRFQSNWSCLMISQVKILVFGQSQKSHCAAHRHKTGYWCCVISLGWLQRFLLSGQSAIGRRFSCSSLTTSWPSLLILLLVTKRSFPFVRAKSFSFGLINIFVRFMIMILITFGDSVSWIDKNTRASVSVRLTLIVDMVVGHAACQIPIDACPYCPGEPRHKSRQ